MGLRPRKPRHRPPRSPPSSPLRVLAVRDPAPPPTPYPRGTNASAVHAYCTAYCTGCRPRRSTVETDFFDRLLCRRPVRRAHVRTYVLHRSRPISTSAAYVAPLRVSTILKASVRGDATTRQSTIITSIVERGYLDNCNYYKAGSARLRVHNI